MGLGYWKGAGQEALDKTMPIHRPQLIGYSVATFTSKPATHSTRRWMITSCQARNIQSRKVSIQFIR